MSEPKGAGVIEKAAGIWAVSVDRPVATLMIAIGVAVFGALSYGQLSLALMPELTYPTLTVRTVYEGAAPEEVEAEITRPLEEFLRTVEGLRAIHSVSQAGLSDVVLEFQWDTDMDFSSQRVRERIDVIAFPRAAERPLTLRFDPTLDPIMRLGLTSEAAAALRGEPSGGEPPVSLAGLRTFAQDEVVRGLEKIKGVAKVKVHGGREEIVRVDLNQQKMSQLGLTVAEVQQRLAAENVNLAGGQIEEGGVRYLVRTLNEFEDLDELRQMSVGQREGGSILLADIGSVTIEHKDREVITRIDRRESVEIEIYKEADANIVQVAALVRDRLFGSEAQRAWVKEQAEGKGAAPPDKPEARGDPKEDKKREAEAMAKASQALAMTDFITHTMPASIKIELLSDQSTFIRNAIDEVVSAALLGGLYAILILYLFLRSPSNTVIISLAIPLSVVATFALMRTVGVTLNIMSLGGLALGIGMLVDNGVVVLESIHRCREEGDGPRDSAIRGTREVGGAVTASTLTTVAVFFPIVFIDGVAGQLFGDLAMAVVFSLMASLVVALFVVPMLAARDVTARAEVAEAAPEPWRVRLGRWARLASFAALAEDARARISVLRARSLWRGLLLAPVEVVIWAYLLLRALVALVLEIVFAKVLLGLIAGVLVLSRALVFGVLAPLLRLALFPLVWTFDKGFGAMVWIYPSLLRAALSRRLTVMMLSTGLFGLVLWVFGQLGMELIPELHQGEFRAEIRMPVGTGLEETAAEVERVEAMLAAIPGVARQSSFIGVERTSTTSGDQGEHSAAIHIHLAEARDIEAAEGRAMAEARRLLSARPGVQSELVRPTLFSLQTPIQVEVRGHDLRLLKLYSDQIAEVMQAMPELTDIRASLKSGYPEVQIRFDRDKLAAYGLTVRGVAEVVQNKVRGQTPSTLRRDERRLDILVRARRQDIGAVSDLKNMVVGHRAAGPTGAAGLGAAGLGASGLGGAGGLGALEALGGAGGAGAVPVLLGSVAEVRIEEGPSEIRHLDGVRAAVIEANTTGLDLQTIIDRVEGRLSLVRLPKGFQLTVGGQSGEIAAARTNLMLALLLAIFLVYIVMASQFESVIAPLVIIFTIPLAAIGVGAILWVTATPLSVVVFIGMIMLAGIVVNNAIVLIDYAIQLHERGMPRREALIEACTVRLRPVLITTLTTVLGLLPMALGLGEGAEIRAPMALTVIAGLVSSTALTLLVIPVVYDLVVRGGPPASAAPAEIEGPEGPRADLPPEDQPTTT